jgi:beta-galactosidase
MRFNNGSYNNERRVCISNNFDTLAMKTLFVFFFFLMLSPYYSRAQVISHKFELGKGVFLMDGNPFVVKAAELHYPRIPQAYWEHRIKMCKALGMNTICMYIFWNIHEQEEGQFDFSGQNDIVTFCKLAQKHGMYVIVRPGPYVCAEWEMGGLPWWLLKNKNVALRTLDPYYMERVGIFLKEVGKQLASLQVTKGGNIIMVQVENEYGSYGTDKPYVSAIRDLVRKSGFTDIPLFQCDWSSNFTKNALDDLLWTINFGTGADVEQQFKKLKELRPDTPLMCSEYWSGWFDHWGRKHETRPAKNMVRGIKDMLDRNISFSLYMTHGGTTFGHWGGANNPSYSAMCSSYDYDAPITEAGWTTDKYFLLRDLLKTYLADDETLPEVPAALPVIEIPEFHFTKVAPLFSDLPEAKKMMDIQTMEYFNQGWGTILYRTNLPVSVKAGTTLEITEVHDWAQVYIDGKLLACLDRREGEFTTMLPALKKNTRLDILVEAMGRVNFNKSIHDRKGITEKVELVYNGRARKLENWAVYNFPVDYSFSQTRNYRDGEKQKMPAYYKTTFQLDKVGDTFFDMTTWGKGMVWVNGHALGRFWEIGPQQTLYMPGCWLKKGENEILVLDLKGPKVASVRGLKKPILDILREREQKTHRKEGEVLNLVGEKAVHEGSFTASNGWQEVHFQTPSKGRFFCFEALSSHTSDGVASIAEFEVLGVGGNPISREHWKISYAGSEEIHDGNYTADKIFDLQESTFWKTANNVNYPHHLVIDLSKVETITGFRYLPRAEKKCPGMIKDYRIYIRVTNFRFTD